MGCPGLFILWTSGAAGMYLWSRGEKEVEILRRLPAARSRLVTWPKFLIQGINIGIFL